MKTSNTNYLAITALFSLFMVAQSLSVFAEEKPLWEIGAGLTVLNLPNYRGSAETDLLTLPFPYLVYRGKKFRMDRNGMRGNLFNNDRLSLEISASASPPVNSSDNPLRESMPDLDPTFEIGPRLKLVLKNYDNAAKLSLEMPLRAMLSTDFTNLRYQGWLFHPNLNLDIPHLYNGWKLGIQLGPIYGNSQYHDYFYGVDSSFATATRQQFTTKSGYSGFAFLTAATKRYEHLWVGAFLRYDNLSGTDISSSPLVNDNETLIMGAAIAWVFSTSSSLVAVDDDN